MAAPPKKNKETREDVTDPKVKKGHDIFKRIIRESSKVLLETQSKKGPFDIVNTDETSGVLAHWMSLILVSGSAVRLTYKVYFTSKLAQSLASAIYRKDVDAITDIQGLDFMREYCNMVAGAVKKSLLQIGIKTGVSLPVVTRGFDDLFFSNKAQSNGFIDRWSLQFGDLNLFCSAMAEFQDAFDLTQLAAMTVKSSTDPGDVEFL